MIISTLPSHHIWDVQVPFAENNLLVPFCTVLFANCSGSQVLLCEFEPNTDVVSFSSAPLSQSQTDPNPRYLHF